MHSKRPLLTILICFLIKISYRQGVFSFSPLATSVNRLWKEACFSGFPPVVLSISFHLQGLPNFPSEWTGGWPALKLTQSFSCLLYPFKSDWFFHCPQDHNVHFYLYMFAQAICPAQQALSFPLCWGHFCVCVGGGGVGGGDESKQCRKRQQCLKLGGPGYELVQNVECSPWNMVDPHWMFVHSVRVVLIINVSLNPVPSSSRSSYTRQTFRPEGISDGHLGLSPLSNEHETYTLQALGENSS